MDRLHGARATAILLAWLALLLPVLPAHADHEPTDPNIVPPEPSYFRSASPDYGVNVFLRDSEDPLTQLWTARASGFTWQKSLFRWRDVEGGGKGQFFWDETDAVVRASEDAGLKLIARLDFPPAWAVAEGVNNGPPLSVQDYTDYVHHLVWRYRKGTQRGRLHAVEIWNEPNLAREWGGRQISPASAAEYVQLLCAAYQAAKSADPFVTVVSAGLSPTGVDDGSAQPDDLYLQWLYDSGMHGCYDVLGANAPGFKAAPSVSPEEAAADAALGGHRSFTFRHVEDLRALMERNGDADRQIWVMEMGWTTDRQNPAYSWHAVTEEQQAGYLVDAYRWALEHWQPWIGMMATWTMANEHWTPVNEEYWWSITNPDGSPRLPLIQFSSARSSGLLPLAEEED